jgi:hypothetical protein
MHGLITALPITQLVHAHNDNYCGVVKEDPWAKHFMVDQTRGGGRGGGNNQGSMVIKCSKQCMHDTVGFMLVL